MTTTYTRSIITDFGGSISPHILQSAIVASSIVPTILYINTLGDEVYIVFNTSLSAGEITTLNTLIAAHTAVIPLSYKHIIKFNPKNTTIKQTTFKREDTLIYQGTDVFGTVSRISAIAYMDSGVTSYTIKIYDKTNNATIVETTFTNTEEDIVHLTPIQNVPTSEAVFELLVKKTGGKGNENAYIDSVTVYMI